MRTPYLNSCSSWPWLSKSSARSSTRTRRASWLIIGVDHYVRLVSHLTDQSALRLSSMSTPGEYRLSPPTRASENANASRPSTNDNQTTEPNDSSIDSLDNPGLAVQQSRGGMSSILMMTIVLFMLTNNGGVRNIIKPYHLELTFGLLGGYVSTQSVSRILRSTPCATG